MNVIEWKSKEYKFICIEKWTYHNCCYYLCLILMNNCYWSMWRNWLHLFVSVSKTCFAVCVFVRLCWVCDVTWCSVTWWNRVSPLFYLYECQKIENKWSKRKSPAKERLLALRHTARVFFGEMFPPNTRQSGRKTFSVKNNAIIHSNLYLFSI